MAMTVTARISWLGRGGCLLRAVSGCRGVRSGLVVRVLYRCGCRGRTDSRAAGVADDAAMRRTTAHCAIVAGLLGMWLTVTGGAVAGLGGRVMTAARPGRLVAITAGHHSGYDRVVFRFSGPLPARRTVGYVPRLVADPSGRPVAIAGQRILQVTFAPAVARRGAEPSGAPQRVAFALPEVMSAVRSGEFEAVVSYGLGLAGRAPFHVHTVANPSRLVIDVGVAVSTVLRRVYLLDRARFAVGREPAFVPVLRPVPAMTPATGLMDRLFAGPTPTEAAHGLAFISSGASGYGDLSITGGVARVRLTGGCSSGGSTASIADEISLTLRQLPAVRFVKIYDPAGHTARPTGPTDSRPDCLEP